MGQIAQMEHSIQKVVPLSTDITFYGQKLATPHPPSLHLPRTPPEASNICSCLHVASQIFLALPEMGMVVKYEE